MQTQAGWCFKGRRCSPALAPVSPEPASLLGYFCIRQLVLLELLSRARQHPACQVSFVHVGFPESIFSSPETPRRKTQKCHPVRAGQTRALLEWELTLGMFPCLESGSWQAAPLNNQEHKFCRIPAEWAAGSGSEQRWMWSKGCHLAAPSEDPPARASSRELPDGDEWSSQSSLPASDFSLNSISSWESQGNTAWRFSLLTHDPSTWNRKELFICRGWLCPINSLRSLGGIFWRMPHAVSR